MVVNRLLKGKGNAGRASKGTRGRNIEAPSEERLERNIKTPRDRDILLGRGRTSWSHSGNQQFRAFVGTYLKRYADATNRAEKTSTVHLIYDEIIKSGGRFLKLDSSTNTWYQVGKSIAREKIAHALRDAIGLRIKLTPPDAEDPKNQKNAAANSTRSTSRKRNSNDANRSQGSQINSQKKEAFPAGTVSTQGILAHKTTKLPPQQYLPTFEGRDAHEVKNINLTLKACPPTMHPNMQLPSAPQSMQVLLANQNTEALDDELSTGFSAMSIESLRSGKSGKSGRSRGREKSAVFELSDEFRTFRSGSAAYSSEGRSQIRQQDIPSRTRGDIYETAGDMSVGGDSLEWIRGNCIGEGMSEIGSLDDFSLTSNRTGHSRNSNKYHGASVGEMESISKGSSEKSTETEIEWRRTLKALRGV